MTNKVKPFFIRITNDMTPQMVQDAFDKCVDAGANAEECIADTNRKHSYQGSYGTNFNYLGTSCFGGTYLADNCRNYGEEAQEITLDQLDEWLGLEGEQEWKNGDECVYKGNGAVVIGWHPSHPIVIVDSDEFGLESCSPCELSKPETPEQKAERERLEAIETMCDEVDKLPRGEAFAAMATLYDLGYRKQ